MTEMLVRDLIIESTGSALRKYYSPAISVGSDNAALLELWITALSGTLTGDIEAFIEGSNDGTNYDAVNTLDTAVASAAPAWVPGAGSRARGPPRRPC